MSSRKLQPLRVDRPPHYATDAYENCDGFVANRCRDLCRGLRETIASMHFVRFCSFVWTFEVANANSSCPGFDAIRRFRTIFFFFQMSLKRMSEERCVQNRRFLLLHSVCSSSFSVLFGRPFAL